MKDALGNPIQAFQSTPLREGRPSSFCGSVVQRMFQSTPLREGRRPSTVYALHPLEFQSTPLREGRLNSARPTTGCIDVSIHAPARGATLCRITARND